MHASRALSFTCDLGLARGAPSFRGSAPCPSLALNGFLRPRARCGRARGPRPSARVKNLGRKSYAFLTSTNHILAGHGSWPCGWPFRFARHWRSDLKQAWSFRGLTQATPVAVTLDEQAPRKSGDRGGTYRDRSAGPGAIGAPANPAGPRPAQAGPRLINWPIARLPPTRRRCRKASRTLLPRKATQNLCRQKKEGAAGCRGVIPKQQLRPFWLEQRAP